jgi:hypothetical protein
MAGSIRWAARRRPSGTSFGNPLGSLRGRTASDSGPRSRRHNALTCTNVLSGTDQTPRRGLRIRRLGVRIPPSAQARSRRSPSSVHRSARRVARRSGAGISPAAGSGRLRRRVDARGSIGRLRDVRFDGLGTMGEASRLSLNDSDAAFARCVARKTLTHAQPGR